MKLIHHDSTTNNSSSTNVALVSSNLFFLGLMTLLHATGAFLLPAESPSVKLRSHPPWGIKPSATAKTWSPPCITTSATRITKKTSTTTTELSMVFDFFKKRSQEGIDQLSKLSDAAAQGQLGKGLADAASYTSTTNRAFADGLAKSRTRFLSNLESIFVNGIGVSSSDEDALEDLQDVLLQADLGMATAEDIVREVRMLREDSTVALSREDLMSIMRGKLLETLDFDSDLRTQSSASSASAAAIRFASPEERARKIPTTLFVMGANGMGKTTTIGKLAHRLRVEGNQTVLVAACDTFRAAAVEQLQQWADRAEVDLYGPSDREKSPAAIVYGALDKAIKEEYDTVLVDTSGRLSNNYELTEELAKMKRAIQKRLSMETGDDGQPLPNTNVPHETLLVLDAAQGRMALDSARVWNKEIGLTGLILTKLDGSARGGSVVAISRDLDLPVKLIGVGEGIDDLRDFEPEKFVDGLLGIGAAGGKSSSSSSEGAMLASRLETLRKERAERSPSTAQKKNSPVATASVVGDRPGPVPGVRPLSKRNVLSKRANRRKKAKR